MSLRGRRYKSFVGMWVQFVSVLCSDIHIVLDRIFHNALPGLNGILSPYLVALVGRTRARDRPSSPSESPSDSPQNELFALRYDISSKFKSARAVEELRENQT